jgi:ribulose-5-phosphate 4-epimerase/fuculose-1-phosphate aldolase
MLNQDVCYFHDSHNVYDSYGGIAFGADEGRRIAQSLGHGRASILVNHGLTTVGGTVDEAAYLFTLLEKSCRIQLLVEAAGLPKRVIPDAEAADIRRTAGDPVSRVHPSGLRCQADFEQECLYVEFQPMYKLEEHLDPSFKD